MVKRLFGRRSSAPEAEGQGLDAASRRAETLVEESREHVVVLDADRRVLAASRRARQSLEGVVVGEVLPERLLEAERGPRSAGDRYEVERHAERRSSTSVRPATSLPIRSCAPASPRPSRTSCARRWRG